MTSLRGKLAVTPLVILVFFMFICPKAKALQIDRFKDGITRNELDDVLSKMNFRYRTSCLWLCGGGWRYYGFDDTATYRYDSDTITRLQRNIVRVWVRKSYSEKGVERTHQRYGDVHKNLDYSLSLFEINCGEKSFRVLTEKFYSDEGNLLGNTPPDTSSEWVFIRPGSIHGALYKAVCE